MYNIAQSIIDIATVKSIKLATAESITGGAVAAALTAIPGASQVFEAGYVVYTAVAKETMLGVSSALIEQYGTVSAQCARAMAQGALGKLGQNSLLREQICIAVATTGNAGPTVDSAGSGVGQVYIAIATRGSAGQVDSDSVNVTEHNLSGSRAEIQQQVLTLALQQLLEACAKL